MTGALTRTQRLLLLGAGDAAILILFTIGGTIQHSEQPILLTVLERTALPLLVAWFAIAPLLGAYSARWLSTPLALAFRTTYTWIAAGLAGIFLRAALFQRDITETTYIFIAITLGLNLVGLLAWRLLFFRLFLRHPSQAPEPAAAAPGPGTPTSPHPRPKPKPRKRRK